MRGIPSETIKDPEGRVLLFSCEQFVEDICQGSCCFICGAQAASKEFNNEHVLPRWILERYNLFNKTMILPNGQKHRYGTYTIPCCKDCNSLLGESIETPMSEMLRGSYSEVVQKIELNQELLFIWLCLLFVKIHLKDKFLRANLDYREEQYSIAEGCGYFWPEVHHIHAVARSVYSGAGLTTGVIGSIIVLPIQDPTTTDQFDWMDITNDQTVIVRIGNVGIVAVLNDAGECTIGVRDFLLRIQGSIGTTQLRELGARMATANADLVNRPSFGTTVSTDLQRTQIWADYSETEFRTFDHSRYGERLVHALSDRLESLSINDQRGEENIRAILMTGKASFIVDSQGKFNPKIEWMEKSET